MCMQRLRERGRQREASVPTNGKFSLSNKWSNVLFQHYPNTPVQTLGLSSQTDFWPYPHWTPTRPPLEGSGDNPSGQCSVEGSLGWSARLGAASTGP